MPEQITIASLRIDTEQIIKDSTALKKQIDSLKKSQKELKDAGEDTTEQYVEQEAEIKKLNKAYRDNQKAINTVKTSQDDLNKSLEVEGKSRRELVASRAELNQISQDIKGNTEEEIALREKINETINEQTQRIKELSPEYVKQKEEIGAYTEGINKSDLSLRGFIEKSQDAGGASKVLSGGLKTAFKSMLSFTKATLTFLATPVGIVLGLIAGAFLLIKNAMNRSEEATTKIKTAFAAFEGIVKFLQKALEPLGKFLIDGIVVGLEKVAEVAGKASVLLQKVLKRLGFNEAAEKVEEFTEKVEEAVKVSQELTKAELAYARAQRESRKVQLAYQKDAEKLRQIRDDESASIAERIKANEDLGRLLQKQTADEIALAQKAVDLAKLRIELDGETTENLDALAAAQTEVLDIEERITGQTSEQLTNRNALLKEAKEAEIALRDEILESYLAEAEAKKKILDDQLAYEKEQLELFADFEAETEAELQKEIEAELAKAREAKIIDAQNRIALAEQTADTEYEILQGRLDREKAAEIAAAEETGANVELIEQKYAANQLALDKYVQNQRAKQYSETFGEIATLLGENTIAGKAAGVAQATVNTYLGATEVLSSPSVLPEPFGSIQKIVSAGSIIGAGLKSVAKITGVSTKFGDGGIIAGASHANGGVPFTVNGVGGFEAEGEETIINKNSSKRFRGLLSAINVAGGGRKFASGGVVGTSTGSSSKIIDYDILASKIAKANESLPAPRVGVDEITTVQAGVVSVEELSSL